MSNRYTTVTVSGYNASPPSDDGAQTAANKVKWNTDVKGKIGDPLLQAVNDIDANVATAFGEVVSLFGDDTNNFEASLSFVGTELTIASGAVEPTRSAHRIDTESDAASDDLATLTVGSVNDGGLLLLTSEDAGRVVTVKDGVGNIHTNAGADVPLDVNQPMVLFLDGTDWYEIQVSIPAGGIPNNALLNVVQEYTKQQFFGLDTLVDGANISWDLDNSQVATVTLGGDRTLSNPANMKGAGFYTLFVLQDVTGGRTLGFGTAYEWPGGTAPTLSSGSGATDILTFVSDGSRMVGGFALNIQ